MSDPASVLRAIGRDLLLATIAEAMRYAHPDHGGDPAVAEARLRELRDARQAVKEFFGTSEKMSEKPCINCGGKGSVPSTFGTVTCRACQGTGATP